MMKWNPSSSPREFPKVFQSSLVMSSGTPGGRGRVVVRIENADDMEMELSRDAQSLASVNPSPPLVCPDPRPRRCANLSRISRKQILFCSIPLHSLLASGMALK